MPPRERRHEGGGCLGGFFCGWTGSRCGGEGLTTGVVRHACRLRRDGTRMFLIWGDSFAVGLGAVAGACVGRGSGQPRMPPRERQHEGLGGG